MHHRIPSFSLLLAAGLALFCSSGARGEQKAAASTTAAPERREVWVPVKELATVLKNHPDAVVLDAAQYEALIRDAGRVKSADETPPVGAVVESVKLDVALAENSPVVRSTATLVVRGLNEGWSEALLPNWGQWGSTLVLETIEGGRLDVSRWKREDQRAYLFVRGKGRHEVKLGFVSPVRRQGPRCSAVFPVLTDPMQLTAQLRGSLVTPQDWIVHGAAAEIPVTWSWRKAPGLTLQWFEGERPVAAEAGITQTISSFTRLEGAEVMTDVHILLQSSQGLLPERVRFRIPDADAHVVSVDEQYARSWRQDGALIEVELNAGFNASTLVKLQLTRSAPGMAGGSAPLALDLPRMEGAGRIAAHVALAVGEGYEVTAWPAAAAQPVPGENVLLTDPARKDLPMTKASYAVLPANFAVTVRQLSDRYSADVDLLALVSQHDFALTRTLTFRGEEGSVRRVVFSLPQGEQFLSLAFAKGDAIEWKQIEGAAPSIELLWPQGLQKAKTTTLLLSTRKELPAGADTAAANATPATLSLQNLSIPDATRLAGYVALDFDESWKVTTPATTGLELRDARLTPVKGRMAWFHLREFQLGIGLSRHEPVLDATVIAYSLPRARTVEMEGQVTVEVTRAPLRSFTVRVPATAAPLVRWDSPLIGQRILDEATGTWTLTLRKELLGVANLRWHLSLPGEESVATAPPQEAPPVAPDAAPPNSSLSATLPRFELPTARRFTGAWVIEANTDTELTFATKGLQPLDALRAPRMEGYVPRHRVLAAYGYGAAASELRVTATRHESTRLTSAIVEALDLASVLSRDGTGRHQAVMRVRHSGDQFFAIRLPDGATLLSTAVEHGLTKPVTAGPGEVRVPLPRQKGGNQVARVTVVYETSAGTWSGSGSAALQPLAFDAAVPVLRTAWRVHAPDGYSYVAPQTTLMSRYGESTSSLPAAIPVMWRSLAARLPRFPDFGGLGFKYAHENRVTAVPGTEMIEITPQYPKPMFVGTPVPLYTDRPTAGLGDGQAGALIVRLGKIIIPSLQLNGASLDSALETLRTKAREHDPDKRGVNLVVSPGAPPSTAQITLDLKDVPFDEALKYVTDLAGMKYRVQGERIVVAPLSDVTADQYTRRFLVPSNFLETIAGTGSQDSIQAVLQANGIPFPQGASATFNPAKGELIVKNTQPGLDQVQQLIEELTPKDRVETPAEYRRGGRAVSSDAGAYYAEKMKQIIFPQVQFNGASVEEAIEFLRLKSRDNDSLERDPSKRGINLIIKPGAAPSTAQITLDLKDVPMSEALKYITDLGGMKFRIEPYAVVVVPLGDITSDQYTRTFKVPPDFLTYTPKRKLPAAANRALTSNATVNVLTANGIAFPEGASASFVPSTNQLIVRNTQPVLDQLEEFIEELWRDYEERNPRKVDSAKSGLLPVKLEVPASGRVFEFHGNQKPEPLMLSYQSWERQMAKACFWLLAGLLLFGCCGRQGASWRTLLVALVLICLPLALLPSWLAVCNAILAGWLLGLIVWLLWRAARWVERQELAARKEVAA